MFDAAYWEEELKKMGLPELPIRAVTRVNLTMDEIREQNLFLNKIRRDFMKFISYTHIRPLVRIGLKRIHVEGMMRKGICPPNCMVHLRVPLEYGGKPEFPNLYFMRRRPVDDLLGSFFDMQRGENGEMPEELFVPNPKDKVLVTMFNGTIGGGGNTSSDRLSELASIMNKQTAEAAKASAEARAAALAAAIAAKAGKGKK